MLVKKLNKSSIEQSVRSKILGVGNSGYSRKIT